MYTIAKQFEWSGGHHLDGVPEEHQCARDHGHNWIAEVALKGRTLSGPGWVMDYGEMNRLKAWIDKTWDHRDLNECWPWTESDYKCSTTAEAIAGILYDLVRDWGWPVAYVQVSETPKTWARYEL